MNKKGFELPTNALIILLLAIVAGGVVLIFFLGGAAPLTRTLQEWWRGSTAGTDKAFAIELCNKYCLDAKSWSADDQKTSPYCTKYWNIDTDNNAEAEYKQGLPKGIKLYDQYFCSSSAASKAGGLLKTETVDDKEYKADAKSLNVGCAGVTC